MTVIHISIYKQLVGGLPVFHRTEPFTSEYLVQTQAPFPSDQLQAYARSIARAESRLYPSWVRFERAIVKLATPGASGAELRGQYSQVELDKLPGQMQVVADEPLAFPPVTALFSRQASWGRSGRLLLPHILLASEWHAYVHQGQVPSRFRAPKSNEVVDKVAAAPNFSTALIEAVWQADGGYVLPAVNGEEALALRRVRDFMFLGFETRGSQRRRRKSVKRASVRAASSSEPKEGVVYLLQSGPYYKIGKSVNFQSRLNRIKLLLPDPVKVVHVMRAVNPSAVESHWHRRFAAKRRGGEWFALSDEEVALFKSVAQM